MKEPEMARDSDDDDDEQYGGSEGECPEGGDHECDEDGVCLGCGRQVRRPEGEKE
jgi:hypothetical protein